MAKQTAARRQRPSSDKRKSNIKYFSLVLINNHFFQALKLCSPDPAAKIWRQQSPLRFYHKTQITHRDSSDVSRERFSRWLSERGELSHRIFSQSSPWQAPVRIFGMKPRRQGWGWAGHISQGWPQARPTVAQHRDLVHTIPVSWPWHICLFTCVKHGPVL